MNTVICHTSGCLNQDVPIPMELSTTDPETDQPVYVDSVTCGPCGQPITDITPPIQQGAPV